MSNSESVIDYFFMYKYTIFNNFVTLGEKCVQGR